MKMQKVLHLEHELAKKKPKIEGKYFVTEKLDGWYGYMDYTVEYGWSRIKSSRGRIIPAFEWFYEIAKTGWQPAFQCRLIFELIIFDTPFHIANGIFNRKSEQAVETTLVFHDLVPLNSDICLIAAYKRYQLLKEHFNNLWPHTKVAPLLTISDKPSEWEFAFREIVDGGGEGVILKQLEGLYQPNKRNYTLMKMKQTVSLDLEIVDVYPSQGKLGNKAMNLIVRRKSGVELSVVVPKHSDLKLLMETPGKFIGRVAEITAMQELPGGKLREPRFKCFRLDKTLNELLD